MEQDDRLVLSSSFGAAAVAYAEHRPDYAQAAVRWALEPAPGLRVLDLGAGTGKLTATLVALGVDVVAVEPDPAMLAELRRTLADVRALPGSTADMHLPKTDVAAWFGSPEQAEFPHGQRRTAGSLVETLATRAGMLVMPEQEREATLGQVRAYLASRPETADGEFTLPMLTCVLRVRRP
ncbi:methyltransferase domain-containing protein [Streptosporangium subroseum]|uniref:methyltransferase domain-containing protein n=1 Tax=Streptosporangium subroseum TaxID=106412 RepID=UPI00341ADB25